MTREEILQAAQSCVCGEREEDYGTPENSFGLISSLWSDYLAHSRQTYIAIQSDEVAIMMALLKIARIAAGSGKADNWIDLAGYAACGGEIATGG